MVASAELFDVLIVGGGPGGTAAAFRAAELGLQVVVIEYDDLMKRIRDYSKDKLILPTFGGGDRMCFPAGGHLIEQLCFAPIDKDDMCACWKEIYPQAGISVRVGVELTGLECRPDGVYQAQAWDHSARCEAPLLARHVVLALGRGVPRRFDIPGNTDGIANRLEDPKVYVGAPSCVVGGGTSAAEAVIALSNAKAAAGDPTAVYWSYRGDKMPRVSKALAEVFFEAYVGNGNIRYFPRSEPAAVVTAEDRREYLAIRVDRRRMEGRPAETAHLEFLKESCIACIGEDIPEALLATLGVHMVVGGAKGRKRMVVNRYLETERSNVYLVGDILSQAYLETDNFAADPAGFKEIIHRGNIKSALRDGVRVAQVIQQRMAGLEEIDIGVEDVPLDVVPEGEPHVMAFNRSADPAPGIAAAAGVEPAPEGGAILVRVLPGGVQGDETPLQPGAVLTLGRKDCDLSFQDDTMLAARHASVALGEDGCFLRDDGSTTGVFLCVPASRKVAVNAGDLLRAGRQYLLVARTGDAFSLTHYDHAGRELGRYPVPPEHAIVLGRKAPDVTLDPGDTTLSRRHLAFALQGGKLLVKDLRSANGTYLRVSSAIRLEHGDQFRLGQQRFAYSTRADAVLDLYQGPVPGTPPSAEIPIPKALLDGGPAVTFRGVGTFPVQPGQTLCDVAEANGVSINAECHAGICGSDPVRILSGHENLEAPPSDGESETLEDLCSLEPGPCRLACMAKPTGPVEVEIL